jgi:hypothetical protein
MTRAGRHDTLNPVIPAEEPGPIHTPIVQRSAPFGEGGFMGPGFGCAATG